MGLLKEFKEFAVKGNAVDMAVGIVVGAAFNKIISSLVNDVIMPPIGLLLGGVDFKNLELVLKKAGVSAAVLAIGQLGFCYNNSVSVKSSSKNSFIIKGKGHESGKRVQGVCDAG